MTDRVRVVLDTNIFVSGFLFGGKPARLLDLVEGGSLVLVHSPDLRREVEGILADKFDWAADEIRFACDVYWDIGVSVAPQSVIRACRDPDDNRILECAVDGRAQYIIQAIGTS